MKKYSHAIEKLTNVLECLATHPGDARARLISAYSQCAHLRTDELPKTCRGDWEWIMNELGKRGPLTEWDGKPWRGHVENTMRNARNSTASKIAKRFYKLYWKISANTQYA